MDPLSALSIVAAVVQFVDFGSTVVKEFKDIYRAGNNLSQRNADLKDFATRLKSQIEGLTGSDVQPVDQAMIALSKVREQCLSTGEELTTILDRVAEPRSKRHWWQATISSSKAFWWRKDIERIQEQLEKQVTELNSHVLSDVRKLLQQHIGLIQDKLESMSAQQRQIAEALIAGKQNVWDLTEALTKLSSHVAQIDATQKRHIRDEDDHRLRESLHFDAMGERQRRVDPPTTGTFDWLLDGSSMADTDTRRPTLDYPLHEWLMNQENLYWIYGKPGSGKSTLMNMLDQKQRATTLRLLSTWSKGEEVFLTSYFFWKAGRNPYETTINGLLKTLLFRIVDQHKNLTCHLRETPADQITRPVWTVDKLKLALFRILECDNRPAICFLIDALDENVNDDAGLLELISEISKQKRVKVCLSSRWKPIFAQALSGKPHLILEHITADDIDNYVREKFARIAPARHDLSKVMANISERARGVFLWVKYVVENNLGDNLINESEQRLLDLVRRTPDEMELLYNQMFERVHEDDKRDVALLFQMVMMSPTNEAFHSNWSSTIDLPLTALTLFENEAVGSPNETSKEWVLNCCNRLTSSLQNRCFGLLEFSGYEAENMWREEDSAILNLKLTFIHETAATFIWQTFNARKLSWIDETEISGRLFHASCRLVYCQLEVCYRNETRGAVRHDEDIDYYASIPFMERVVHWVSRRCPITQTIRATEIPGEVCKEMLELRIRVKIRSKLIDKFLDTATTGTVRKVTKFTIFDLFCILNGFDIWAVFILCRYEEASQEDIKEELTLLLALSLFKICCYPHIITWRNQSPGELKQPLGLISHWIQLKADVNAKIIRPDGTHFVDGPVSAWSFFLVWLWGVVEESDELDKEMKQVVLAFLEGGASVSERVPVVLEFGYDPSLRFSDEEDSDTTYDRPVFTVGLESSADFILSTRFGGDEQILDYIRHGETTTEAGYFITEIMRFQSSPGDSRDASLPIEPVARVTHSMFTPDQQAKLTDLIPIQHYETMHRTGQRSGTIHDREPMYELLREMTAV